MNSFTVTEKPYMETVAGTAHLCDLTSCTTIRALLKLGEKRSGEDVEWSGSMTSSCSDNRVESLCTYVD
jgi:hypothetical protein